MKTAIVTLESTSPYSQSKHIDKFEVPELPKESKDDYEIRTWRNRMHVDSAGFVEIPGTAFANCVKDAAKKLRMKIPNMRGSEYGKYFEAGVMCTDGIKLPVKADDVKPDRLFVPADGTTGGNKRVTRYFPRIDAWRGDVTFYIFDDLITEDVFRRALESAGLLVGIGRFRPQNRGFYGRFVVSAMIWMDDASDVATDEAAE